MLEYLFVSRRGLAHLWAAAGDAVCAGSGLGLMVLALFAAAPALAQADFAVSVSGGSEIGGTIPYPLEIGWSFTPSANLTVTALGTWAGTTLPAGTEVAIYGAGAQLALVTIPDTATDTNGFKYVSLSTPVTLQAGTGYTILTYFPTETAPSEVVFSSTAFAPSLTGVHFTNSYLGSPGLQYIGTVPGGQSDYVQFGPNFEFQAAVASPEPASLTLLGVGLAGLAVYGWRRGKPRQPCKMTVS